MKRRDFIKGISAVSAPLIFNGIPLSVMAKDSVLARIAADSPNDKVLILIQLHGGNDGLNTLIPISQYNLYADLRPNIRIPDKDNRKYIELDKTLPDTQRIGLHPEMGAMKALYDAGKMAVVQNVGYPDLNQSHFRGRDIWLMGGGANDYFGSGWMGRLLQTEYPGYPTNFPNTDMQDPPAIEIGRGVSLAFHGDGEVSIPLSLSIDNPEEFYNLIQDVRNTTPPDQLSGTYYKEELEFIVGMEKKSDQYAGRLKEVFEKGSNTSSVVYPTTYHSAAPKGYDYNELAPQLKLIARLLKGGCKTKIFLTRITKFDTHANQVERVDPTIGAHAALLYHMSTAMKAFQDDLLGLGLENKVMSATFSEFGRRAASNNSYGTDHGNAAPMFVFGSCVKPGVFGHPDLANLDGGNIKMQYDYRQVFTSLVTDWLGASDSALAICRFENFKASRLDLVNNCSSLGVDDHFVSSRFMLKDCIPNPANAITTFGFRMNAAAFVSLKLYNLQGVVVKKVINKNFEEGDHEVICSLEGINPGSYIYKIEAGQLIASKKLIIVK